MSNHDTADLILTEVRELRRELSDFRSEIEQRVTTLETQMHPLMDNGQPGRCTRIDRRVTALEHWRIYILGGVAAVTFAVDLLIKLYK